MGFFDEVAGGLLKRVLSGEEAQKGLAESVINFLKSSESGGLTGLADKFNERGLGDILSSWVSQGENLPVSPEQISHVLGTDQIQQIAEKLGISSEEASNGLAELLPQIVDRLTPGGSLPTGDLLGQGLRLISDKLFGK